MKINKTNFPIKIVTFVTYLIMIVANALATLLPINGMTTGEISDSYPNLFAPAGITFSIWGVIYLFLFLYCMYQFGLLQGKEDFHKEKLFKKVGVLFSISSVLNTVWILTWHYGMIGLSVPIMLGILILLILINNLTKNADLSLKDYIFIRLPFSIYLGWITVATIANITTYLVKIGFNGFGISEVLWTIIILLVGVVIAALTIIRNKDVAYGLVIIWAYAGIYIKHLSDTGWNAEYSSIIFTVVASILIVFVVEVYTLFKLRKS
ncbi:MAG: tryptophan-rich sensory protein [Carnobacterium sp.]|uniref:tryptophan-rich sensory protein n=1 Tax=Carnobacterium sp. TaxID=48221 RepID=UPI003C77A997